MSFPGQGDAGELTEREHAAMAEKLGQRLKASLNGGKSQLLKVLKVRETSHPDSPLSPSTPPTPKK